MKKSVLLALAAVALSAGSAVAQEVTYVEDCTQGLLINKNKNNWFITVEGGANFYMSPNDVVAPIKDRICGEGALYVGKWITPTFGIRFGGNFSMNKGATTKGGWYRKPNAGLLTTRHDDQISNDLYPEKMLAVGPEFDVLINLTNWWCGYKPNRVYNAIVHGGAGYWYTWHPSFGENRLVREGDEKMSWAYAHNTFLFANIGLMNNFRLGKHVDFFIDLQYQIEDVTEKLESQAAVHLGLTFNLGKTDWNCPVTAVCPTWKYTDAQGDALVAQLAAANNRISNLQEELDACLRRPAQQVANDCEGLATVYYPINQSSLSLREKTILKSVAQVMQNNPEKKYVLTGWADNYTGTEEINVRLRNARVDGVYNYLVKNGVNANQLDKTIDNNNLTDFGAKAAPLDRAVTIRLAE